ncbi:jerky protein homolog-like [Procambarus clarkii]|uniref:jerky protein homolog-like n=1 Tax=Procambarus clarkii TaxID=6728 RepID=UPI003742BAF6
MVRSSKNPLVQIAKRLKEMQHAQRIYTPNTEHEIYTKAPNNAYLLNNETCCQVLDTVSDTDENGDSMFLCRVYSRSIPLFETPCNSKLIGSFKVLTRNSSMKVIPARKLNRTGNMLQAIYTEVNELKSDVKILKTTLTTKETDKIIEDLIPNPIAAEGDLNALNKKLAESSFRTKFHRTAGVTIHGPEIQNAASRFAESLGIKNFEASEGWVARFKGRHNIVKRKIVGEKLSADESSVEPFKHKLREYIVANNIYSYQIYNADETGLYWRSLPEKTLAMRSEGCVPGRKVCKDRLSAMMCANADGTDRITCAIVGKSKKPRALQHCMDRLPNLKNYTIKEAVYNWAKVWSELKESTLKNSWKKLLTSTVRNEEDEEMDFEGFTDEIHGMFRNAGENLERQDVVDWLEQDANDPGYGVMSEDEILQSVTGEVDEEDEEGSEEPTPMTMKYSVLMCMCTHMLILTYKDRLG